MATTKAQIKTLLESDGSVDTKVTQISEWIDEANSEGFDEGHSEGYDEGVDSQDG